jgi:hypothetical protein
VTASLLPTPFSTLYILLLAVDDTSPGLNITSNLRGLSASSVAGYQVILTTGRRYRAAAARVPSIEK